MNRVIANDLRGLPTARCKRIEKILLHCMKQLKLTQTEVHLTLIQDAQMQKLNHTYRNKNKTTDVLSFEQGEQIGTHFFLGDILISMSQTAKQAKQQHHRVKDELATLCIHGLLHLLGYDHIQEKDEKVMFRIQNELFNQTIHY